MASHNDLGLKGEQLARRYLEDKGYRIIVANWRHGRGEIDLIAEFEDTLVFVEVKTRSSGHFGQPDEFVGPKKEQQVATAACAYMEQVRYQGEIRFDIVGIIIPAHSRPEVKHIQDAFFPGVGWD
ncbi:MAG: YraN family protein [Saprospiraceae bacterium]|nr:YraN family protein [Saprospiraceae bacterium]